MITSISRQTAQQIVDTIHDVCDYDINFINPQGNIYASTNPERIGTFHEVGRQAAKTGETIEVVSDEDFAGTRKGINIPIFYHHTAIAVIGITAEPEEARRYAHLAERVTVMLLREQEMNEKSRNIDEQKLYVLRCLQEGDFDNHDYLNECLARFHVDLDGKYRMVCTEVNTRYNLVNISLIEERVRSLFAAMRQEIFAYIYPNRFVGVIEKNIYQRNSFMLAKFADANRHILKTAVGSAEELAKCGDSWRNALTALASISGSDAQDLVIFDDLDLEILLADVSDRNKGVFRKKMLGGLTEEEIKFLAAYYEADMSLKFTAEKLFLHKNTVQQRLNRIEEKTGRNPRKFRDAVLYYLAGKV